MRRDDLIRELGDLIAHLPTVLPPADLLRQATGLCVTARLAFGAGAVSLASLHGDELHYVASAGPGVDEIVGTALSTSRGIAGYVAVTGQSLAIERPVDDDRFALDIAERTGYVPGSLLVVPVRTDRGEVCGVLSVLDRATTEVGSGADALALATAVADQAALLLPAIEETGRAARLLLESIVAAAASSAPSLAVALRRSIGTVPEADADLARVVLTLAELRHADAGTRARVADLLTEIVALAMPARRRR